MLGHCCGGLCGTLMTSGGSFFASFSVFYLLSFPSSARRSRFIIPRLSAQPLFLQAPIGNLRTTQSSLSKGFKGGVDRILIMNDALIKVARLPANQPSGPWWRGPRCSALCGGAFSKLCFRSCHVYSQRS